MLVDGGFNTVVRSVCSNSKMNWVKGIRIIKLNVLLDNVGICCHDPLMNAEIANV